MVDAEINMEPLRWKPVFGYEGIYEVSECGDVKIVKSGKLRKPGKDKDGYRSFDLWKDRKGKTKKRYIIVLEAFVCPRPPGMVGCHNDGSKENDHIDNLRWGTQSDNEQDKKKHGTHNMGSKNFSAKLCESQVIEIKKLLSQGSSQVKIAKQFGVTQAQISLIKRNIEWKHVAA